MKKWLCALALVCGTVTSQALVIEGVNLPPQKTVAGQTLTLNGAGLRTVKLVVLPIKAYVASFYTPQPLRTPEAVMASSGPMQFNFQFLQGASQGQVTDAWTAQFKASVTFTYPGFEKDRDAFIGFFGPIKSGGVETVELVGENTLAYDDGKLKGTIVGRNFQKAFLSLWFGTSPVQDSLKDGLLGR
jgi:hypothetical protein